MAIKNKIEDLERFEEIISVFAKFGFNYYSKKFSFIKSKNRFNPTAKNLRLALIELGPTFIKIGQILSVRPDIIPIEYIKELKKLQEHTEKIPFNLIEESLIKELGKDYMNLFTKLNKVPISTASIAQVHRAKLKTGEDVVLKIQKPDVEKLIKLDIDILRYIVKHYSNFFSFIKSVNLEELIETLADLILLEVDFKNEAKNIEKFRDNLDLDKIIIPEVYSKISTKKVLILSYEEGVSILEYNFKNQELKSNFIQTMGNILSQMVFQDGFFHADPHPGNVYVSNSGKPLLFDFGMVGVLSKNLIETLLSIFMGIFNHNTNKIIDNLFKIAITSNQSDKLSFQNEVKLLLTDFYSKSLKDVSFVLTFYEIIKLGNKYSIVFNSKVVLAAKAMLDFEGIGMQICPELKVEDILKPSLEKIYIMKYNPIILAEETVNVLESEGDLVYNFPKYFQSFLESIKNNDLLIKNDNENNLKKEDLVDMEKRLDKNNRKRFLSFLLYLFLFSIFILIYFKISVLIFGFELYLYLFFLSFILITQIVKD